jgi:hypothetical protein
MSAIPKVILEYHQAQQPVVCELSMNPWLCEFWELHELETFNTEYEVPTYAPGYFGFATSGGGEMFAISPAGKVVCLPFIGMSPKHELLIADSWAAFCSMLSPAA